jgi:hypothetical protein
MSEHVLFILRVEEQAKQLLPNCFMPLSYLAYFPTLKMEEEYYYMYV